MTPLNVLQPTATHSTQGNKKMLEFLVVVFDRFNKPFRGATGGFGPAPQK